MTDKDLGAAAGDIFAKAFTLGYETGRTYDPGALFPATEPAEDGWGDVNPNDPQGRTYRETAEEYYATPVTERKCCGYCNSTDATLLRSCTNCGAIEDDPWGKTKPAEEPRCTICNLSESEGRHFDYDHPFTTELGPFDDEGNERTTPAPAEPAEEETKADCLYCDLLCGPHEAHKDWTPLPAHFLAPTTSSPVVPAPTETGPWHDISEAPTHLTLVDRVGDKWTYDGDNWVTPETAILPVLYINRKYAPFVAAKGN